MQQRMKKQNTPYFQNSYRFIPKIIYWNRSIIECLLLETVCSVQLSAHVSDEKDTCKLTAYEYLFITFKI